VGFKEILAGALGKKPEEAQNLSDEDLAKLLAEVITAKPIEPTEPKVEPTPTEPKQLSAEDIEKVLSDIRGLNSEAARQKMTEVMDDLRRSNAELQASLRLTEAHQRVKSLAEGSRGFIPNVPQQEKLLKILHESDKKTADAVFELFRDIKDKGLVELTERGRTMQQLDLESVSDDPRDLFMKHVKLVEQERKVTLSEAMSIVSSEKPELYDRYRQATDITKAGVN
jgi:hypothetical protein